MTDKPITSGIYKYRKAILLLFAFTTLGTLAGTLLPASSYDLPDAIWRQDKIGHFIMFLIWTTLFGAFLAVKSHTKPKLLAVFLYSAAFGLVIEALQLTLPTNRSAELYDFIADIAGSLAAIGVLRLIFKRTYPTSE